MKIKHVVEVSIIVTTLSVIPNISFAKSKDCKQPVVEFLAEKSVFCSSKDSLTSYIEMAQVFDMDGLNNLVLAGKCNFVPDSEYLRLRKYRSHIINSTDVIAASMKNLTLWTYKLLVSRGNPDNLLITPDQSMNPGIVKNKLNISQCL